LTGKGRISIVRCRLFLVALCAAIACSGLIATGASASTAEELKRPKPAWLTERLSSQIHAAGAEGVRVAAERLNTDCPGVTPSHGVGAAGCIVEPYGCTANFVFTDGSSQYIGTARHCVDVGAEGGNDVGTPLVMQVDNTTLAEVGTTVKHTSGAGDPGNDFALIKLDPAIVQKWGVDPAIPVIGGPQGVYGGCDVQPVQHYGHGYGVAVSQGKPEGGLATNWLKDGYGWTGFGAPGDSGSPVVLASGKQGAGNFTHLIVDLADYPGSDLAGMRLTAILQFAGVSLVNADGSTSTSGAAACTTG